METDEKPQPKNRARFSITSILVLTTVFAAVAASLAHLWRAAHGDYEEIGRFVIVTSMAPLLLLVFASLAFQIMRKISRG